jgi:carboxyl-terminal processing protease
MGANTCQSFVELLKKYENASAVVVDLRGNGGGNLGISNCMLSVFLNPGERIISFQDPWENKTLHQDKASKSDYRFRGNLIVLTNQFSASASEIFAGVVQDYKLGIIVGDRTFGKGTVQGISGDGIPKEFGALQMARTIARFHLPSGRSNQLVGVAPDVLAYSQPIPKEEELMSFREGDQYRFPIPPGPKVQTPANPKAFEVRACIRKNGKAAEVYQKMGDHQLQVAADVAACL